MAADKTKEGNVATLSFGPQVHTKIRTNTRKNRKERKKIFFSALFPLI
jgi:hypothetical protein